MHMIIAHPEATREYVSSSLDPASYRGLQLQGLQLKQTLNQHAPISIHPNNLSTTFGLAVTQWFMRWLQTPVPSDQVSRSP